VTPAAWPRAARTCAAALALTAAAAPASAQLLNLSVSPATIAMPSADPDAVPLVSSAPVSVNYRIRQNNREPWLLTVVANGDLESGAARIDISAVSWLATPSPPFQPGTLSRSAAQTVAAGTGNVASPSVGTLTFRLTNSWGYEPGVYTQTLVFTLSTP
jgi:hypothetical protein